MTKGIRVLAFDKSAEIVNCLGSPSYRSNIIVAILSLSLSRCIFDKEI